LDPRALASSALIEMGVGVGTAGGRNLFQKAKAQDLGIVFIDELD
jgi:ATP-dependent Zn protease